MADYKRFVEPLDIPDITYIPLSALDGDNVVEKSDRTPWYEGTSLLDYLENVPIDLDRNYEDFRLPVQYVLRRIWISVGLAARWPAVSCVREIR